MRPAPKASGRLRGLLETAVAVLLGVLDADLVNVRKISMSFVMVNAWCDASSRIRVSPWAASSLPHWAGNFPLGTSASFKATCAAEKLWKEAKPRAVPSG